MEDYIHISTLNDFVFCPYSIYLQGVYMDTDEGQYKAMPQTQGKVAHQSTDRKTASNRSDDVLSLPVYSEEYGLMGKIDVYKRKEKNSDYSKVFFDALIPYKTEVFKYVQSCYRCFMGRKSVAQYPMFQM